MISAEVLAAARSSLSSETLDAAGATNATSAQIVEAALHTQLGARFDQDFARVAPEQRATYLEARGRAHLGIGTPALVPAERVDRGGYIEGPSTPPPSRTERADAEEYVPLIDQLASGRFVNDGRLDRRVGRPDPHHDAKADGDE